MVVTDLPATSLMLVWQERTALPSTCTVHAPHRPEPQPNLVPVSLRCSRTTQSNGVLASTSTLAAVPLTVNATAMRFLPWVMVDARRVAPLSGTNAQSIWTLLTKAGRGPAYSSQGIFIWRHYNWVPAAGAA